MDSNNASTTVSTTISTIDTNGDNTQPGGMEEHWTSRYWRSACAWVYLAICVCAFIIFPIFSMMVPIFYKMYIGTVVSYTPWVPITLTNGGALHFAFGAILGVSAWGRTKEIQHGGGN